MSEDAADILVVDDTLENREILAAFCQALGHRVHEAANGKEALTRLAGVRTDIVLLDVMMPELDGIQTLKAMQADASLSQVPVIMITSLDEMETVAQCLELGAEDYLPKPFNPTLLKARISGCLGKKRARDREQDLHRKLVASYESLQKSEAMRESLTNMLIHDLKGPLTVISGFINLLPMNLKKQPPDLAKTLQAVQKISLATRQMSAMVDDVLDVSRYESDQMPARIEEVQLDTLLQRAADECRPRAESLGITLHVADHPAGTVVRADASLLYRILQNLLGNSMKYAGQGSTVELSWLAEGDRALIKVSDNGPGIPEHLKEKIFDKYMQVGNRETRSGVGLGLAFCKMAAKAQLGDIWVESADRGACFVVALPLG